MTNWGYLDLLDSAKTAHPYDEPKNWWRPQSRDEQNVSLSLSETGTIIYLAHAQPIVTSLNQSVDLAIFLDSIPYIQLISRHLGKPLLRVAFHKIKNPTPETLYQVMYGYLTDHNFKFSAWPGLDELVSSGLFLRDLMAHCLLDAASDSDSSAPFLAMI